MKKESSYNWIKELDLFEKLTAIQGVSGDESRVREFVLSYVQKNAKHWKCKPVIIQDNVQDALILVFGTPKTAMYAHLDTVGFTVGYNNNLIKVGGPKAEDGTWLVGKDSKGKVECEVMILDNPDGSKSYQAVFSRKIDRGTCLSYRPNYRKSASYVQTPYLDNRMGVWVALMTAAHLEHGAIVFSTYEEHSGGSVGFLGKRLYEEYGVRQALICDITWKTEGIRHGKGVAISMRDSGIPRRTYLNEVISLAQKSDIPFQLEVESAGGSDGQMLQRSSYPIDWVFVGSPLDHVHTPNEKMHLADIDSMLQMYRYLMVEMNR
jgi:putative aminopeptidase FrvX